MPLIDLLKLGPAALGWRIEKAVPGDNIPAYILGTGVADTTTFLRGDLTWAVPPGGGGGATNLGLANLNNLTLDLTSSTGTGITLPGATTLLAGLLIASDKVKLNNLSGINTGDETNASILAKIGFTPYDAANPANYIDCTQVPGCETDPIFATWLAGPPNISEFFNDVPYLTSLAGAVTNVTATLPITSSGGATPDISTSMATNRLIGRSTVGTGVFEEIILGTNLSFTGTTLNAAGSGVTPSALTKTDDTNVTLTLGGTPATALLQAVSLTLGWTGTLADARIASSVIWNAKQDALVSGTNIKTVNGNSLLGAGDVAVGDALVANPLSQFAATTSAQLAGVISDETGTPGALVFSSGPVLNNPVVGTQAADDNSTLAASTAYVDSRFTGMMPFYSGSINPADGTTYYCGSMPAQTMVTTPNIRRIYFTHACTITGVVLNPFVTGASSAQNTEFYVRVNNTTDFQITTTAFQLTAASAMNIYSNLAMSVPIAAGDYIEIKMVCPVYTTNPTGVLMNGTIGFK